MGQSSGVPDSRHNGNIGERSKRRSSGKNQLTLVDFFYHWECKASLVIL